MEDRFVNWPLALGMTGLCAAAAIAQAPWYELKNRPGANFYDIAASFEAAREEREAAYAEDLTRLLAENPDFYELKDDFHYRRWADYVEPRVHPSGDLSLLDIGRREILKMLPLDGRELPPMRGEWEPLGPYADNTGGSGRLTWIEFHPTETNTFMVGAASGGLWFTRDGGGTWSTTTDKLAVLGAAWAVYNPANPDIIYLGTGDALHSKSIGVLKSSDGGRNWNTTGLSFDIADSTHVTKLLIDPRNPDKLFVAASNGLHVSTDGAATFRQVGGISEKVWDVEMHPANSQIIYASTTSIHVSADGGATFSPVSDVSPAEYRMQLAVTPAAPDYVYALRGARTFTDGIYRSTNAGRTFTLAGDARVVGCQQAWFDYALGVSQTNANELAAGCLTIWRSTTGGATWGIPGNQDYHVDIHGLAYHKNGALYALTDGGIWRYTGGSWTNLNNNLNVGQSYRVGVYRNDYDQICTGRQDNGSDIRSGSTGFRRALGGDGMECFWNNTGDRWFGSLPGGGFNVCDYSNGAATNCAPSRPGAAGIWDTPWGQDPNSNTTLFAGRGANMWRSTNSGDSWSQMGTLGGAGDIRNFAVAPSNSRILYVLKGDGVWKTADGGASWTDVTGALSGTPVNAAVSAADPNDVWVVMSGYTAADKVFRSTNGGQAWTNETAAGLPNLPANAIALDNLGRNGAYVGMDAGVYYKRDGHTSWQNFSDRLPNAVIKELEIARKGTNDNDRRLVAATFGRGIWRTKLWDDVPITGTGKQAKLPVLRRLKTSVSGSFIHVSFQLGTDRPEEGSSVLQLATLGGRVVHQERVRNFGLYERRIDLAGHGKGVYLFILKNGRRQVARRVAVY